MSRFPDSFTQNNSVLALKSGLVEDLRKAQQKIIDLEKASAYQNEEHDKTAQALQQTIDDLEAEHAREINLLKENMEKILKENDAITKKFIDQTNVQALINKTAEQNNQLNEEILKLKDEIKSKDERIDNLVKCLDEANQARQYALNQKSELQVDLTTEKEKYKALDIAKQQCEQDIVELNKKFKDLEEFNQEILKKLENTQQHMQTCENPKIVADLEDKVKDITTEKERKEKDIKKLTKDIEDLKKIATEVENKSQDIKKLKQEIERMTNLTAEIQKKDQEINKLKQTIEDLKKLSTEVENKDKEIKKLKQDIEKITVAKSE